MKLKYALISILLLSSSPAFAQRISKELCERVFDSADKVLAPTKVYRRDTYTSDCKYEFDGKNELGFYVSLELFENGSSVKKEIAWHRGTAGVGDRAVRLKSRYWDSEMFIHPKQGSGSSTLVLHRRLYVVVLMSQDKDRLKELEKSLRSEKFAN